MQKQKILIALDYDLTAKKVAEEGYTIAKNMGAEVLLLHVLSSPEYYSSKEHVTIMGFGGYPKVEDSSKVGMDVLKEASQHYLDKSKQHFGDESMQTLVAEGDPAESILKVAKDTGANIIVMGSHSKRWMENITLGSVTDKVLHHSTIPLFIVPTKKRDPKGR